MPWPASCSEASTSPVPQLVGGYYAYAISTPPQPASPSLSTFSAVSKLQSPGLEQVRPLSPTRGLSPPRGLLLPQVGAVAGYARSFSPVPVAAFVNDGPPAAVPAFVATASHEPRFATGTVAAAFVNQLEGAAEIGRRVASAYLGTSAAPSQLSAVRLSVQSQVDPAPNSGARCSPPPHFRHAERVQPPHMLLGPPSPVADTGATDASPEPMLDGVLGRLDALVADMQRDRAELQNARISTRSTTQSLSGRLSDIARCLETAEIRREQLTELLSTVAQDRDDMPTDAKADELRSLQGKLMDLLGANSEQQQEILESLFSIAKERMPVAVLKQLCLSEDSEAVEQMEALRWREKQLSMEVLLKDDALARADDALRLMEESAAQSALDDQMQLTRVRSEMAEMEEGLQQVRAEQEQQLTEARVENEKHLAEACALFCQREAVDENSAQKASADRRRVVELEQELSALQMAQEMRAKEMQLVKASQGDLHRQLEEQEEMGSKQEARLRDEHKHLEIQFDELACMRDGLTKADRTNRLMISELQEKLDHAVGSRDEALRSHDDIKAQLQKLLLDHEALHAAHGHKEETLLGLQGHLVNCKAEHSAMQEELKESQQRISQASDIHDQTEADLMTKLTKLVRKEDELVKEVEDLTHELLQERELRKQAMAKELIAQQTIDEERDISKQTLAKYVVQLEDLQAEVPALKETVAWLQEDLQKARVDTDAAKKRAKLCAELEREQELHRQEIERHQKQVKALREEIACERQARDEVQGILERSQATASTQLRVLQGQLAEAQASSKAELEKVREERQMIVQDAHNVSDKALEARRRLEDEVKELREQLQQAKSSERALQRQLDSATAERQEAAIKSHASLATSPLATSPLSTRELWKKTISSTALLGGKHQLEAQARELQARASQAFTAASAAQTQHYEAQIRILARLHTQQGSVSAGNVQGALKDHAFEIARERQQHLSKVDALVAEWQRLSHGVLTDRTLSTVELQRLQVFIKLQHQRLTEYQARLQIPWALADFSEMRRHAIAEQFQCNLGRCLALLDGDGSATKDPGERTEWLRALLEEQERQSASLGAAGQSSMASLGSTVAAGGTASPRTFSRGGEQAAAAVPPTSASSGSGLRDRFKKNLLGGLRNGNLEKLVQSAPSEDVPSSALPEPAAQANSSAYAPRPSAPSTSLPPKVKPLPPAFLKYVHDVEQQGWDKMVWANGFTLLHWAAKHDNAQLCEWLLAHGADPQQKDDTGKDAFAYAHMRGSMNAQRQLALPPGPAVPAAQALDDLLLDATLPVERTHSTAMDLRRMQSVVGSLAMSAAEENIHEYY
eukprot:TRINITY_DN59161_c0_g1_i1.p1 TRINITY_DN59161_c0_g1~~TRINITY_DN59161_c0_g1_i1.p1  ORF type:complete len:1328 (+),score=349.33 TRINITY_DN59161_c0_g1_i1:80-4063(+)